MPPLDQLPAADLDQLFGAQSLGVPREFMHALHHVMQTEKAGTWPRVLANCGSALGKKIAAALDQGLTRLGQPALGELPLETCVALIERHCAHHGWGLLKLDLTDAPTCGLVVARLDHSFFVEALDTADHSTDALLAGLLQGFFEHVSGQQLACNEIACRRLGAPQCVFVIGAPEQLEIVAPFVGRESADEILERLRA